MTGDLIKAEILAAKIIPDVHPELAGSLELGSGRHSLGLLTCSSDDVAYTALDEATKKADVKVVYARSLYAGSKNATTRFAGEFIGILADPPTAPQPKVRAGISPVVPPMPPRAPGVFTTTRETGTLFAK